MHTIRQLLRIGDEAYVKASAGGGARQRLGIRAGAAAAAASSVTPGAGPLRGFDVGEVTAGELRGSSVGIALEAGGEHSVSGVENSKPRHPSLSLSGTRRALVLEIWKAMRLSAHAA